MEPPLEERLYQAVCRGDSRAVRRLLAKGACANVTSSSGKTALGAAAYLGNIEILQSILDIRETGRLSPELGPGACGGMKQPPHYACHGSPEAPASEYPRSPLGSGEFSTVDSETDAPSFGNMYPFSIDYSQQNQGYYVFIHDDTSPLELSPEWAGAGLEWDEDVGVEALPTSEDDTWAALYRWYAQMLEQTEGLMSGAETRESLELRPADVPDARQRSAAHYAAEQGHTGALRLLLQAGCKVDMMDLSGMTPLHLAASRGHFAAAGVLLSAGADPNRCTLGPDRASALHIAASRGYLHVMEMLLSGGAALELRDGAEQTPLQLAAEHAQTPAALMLLQAGANINIEDIKGSTPLCEAVWQQQLALVEALLAAGARAPPHHHLLHYAVLHRQTKVASLLVEAGGCVDLRDDNGDTPLLLAARSGQPELATILLSHGASVDYPNSLTGSTALHEAVECIAEFSVFEELFTCLQEHRVNLNATSLTGGDTPLFRAILLQRDKAAELLIKHGADVNLCSLQHCVVDNLSLAIKRRSMNVARLLVLAGAAPPADWARVPRPLSHLARLTLRTSLQPAPLFRSVQALPLPTALKGFLMLEDEE